MLGYNSNEILTNKQKATNMCVEYTHFLLLSVNVMPWLETLKWTIVVRRADSLPSNVSLTARATACGPVRDSVSMVFRYRTLQAEKHNFSWLQ